MYVHGHTSRVCQPASTESFSQAGSSDGESLFNNWHSQVLNPSLARQIDCSATVLPVAAWGQRRREVERESYSCAQRLRSVWTQSCSSQDFNTSLKGRMWSSLNKVCRGFFVLFWIWHICNLNTHCMAKSMGTPELSKHVVVENLSTKQKAWICFSDSLYS